MLETGVSAAVGVISLIAAAVLIVAGSWQWPRLIVALVFTGVAGIGSASFAEPMQRQITDWDRNLGQWIGEWTGDALTGVIGLVSLSVLLFWVWRQRIDLRTVGLAAVVPLTVGLIPGAFGSFMTSAVAVVPNLLGDGIAWLFGIG